MPATHAAGGAARERAREAKRAEPAEREPEEHREAMHREGCKPGGKGRKEKERNAPLVLGERERVAIRKENVRVEKMERVVKRLMVVPREDPRVQVRVARVERGVAHVGRPRPRHDDSEEDEDGEHAGVAYRALQRFQVNLRGG